MKKLTICFAAITVLAMSAFYTAKIFAAPGTGRPLAKFMLRQIESVQDPTGQATAFQKTFVQREDGTYAQSETYYVQGRGWCESGSAVTASDVDFDICPQAKSTFPGRGVGVRDRMRTLTTCAGDRFQGAKLVNRGAMFGVRTEELAFENDEEKGLYVVSPDLGCKAISEVNQWKTSGALNGAVTTLATTSLSSEVDERLFTVAKDFKEMKPSEARDLRAALLHSPTTAASYRKVNARWDQRYAAANLSGK
jgi:hypothetical protein